jgi:hypothetical protein
MIAASYKPKKKFMQLAIAEAKRAGDRGDYPIGAVITRVSDGREVVIANAGNRVKTSGSSIKHVELETLKYDRAGMDVTLPSSCSTLRTNPVPCVRVHASGQELMQSYTECHRKTSTLMVESVGRNNTSGERASFPADSSSRRAITLYP